MQNFMHTQCRQSPANHFSVTAIYFYNIFVIPTLTHEVVKHRHTTTVSVSRIPSTSGLFSAINYKHISTHHTCQLADMQSPSQ